MANLKETVIELSVSSTMQITSAMKMVSAKLKKAQDAITAMPLCRKLTELLQNFLCYA
jgi:F0F1-type ATP synthase gamma subunit